MRKIKIKELTKYSGKILFEVSKQLKMEVYFDNGPITDNDYEISTKTIFFEKCLKNENMFTRIFIDNRDPCINKFEISLEVIQKNNVQFFIPNKKELAEIKTKLIKKEEAYIDSLHTYIQNTYTLNKLIRLIQ